jgi:multiple sugar transport system ATP-binding protein
VNRFVAGFIGSPAMSLCTLPVRDGAVELGGTRIPVADRGEVVVGLRPEAISVGANGVPARVEVVEELGADAYVFCTSDAGRFVARTEARATLARGERVSLAVRGEEAHLFDAVTGDRL